jgi:ubiquinone/menaquinone biosynthesis C-methylase UbiE
MVDGKVDSKRFFKRFDGRAETYSRHRPRYPLEVLHTLEKEIGLDREKVVADIGSGTGILSELFLENGNTVYCVEPNREMRRAAEKNLSRFAPRFISVDGTAEMTNLRDGSIDLIVVGQALHWFNIKETRREFHRILKGKGHIAIVYNFRKEEGKVEEAYAEVTDKFGRNRADTPDVDDAYIRRFLKNGKFKKFVIPNSQTLDLKGMLGRLASTSSMPPPGSREWIRVEEEVQKIFDKYSDNGLVVMHYDTTIYLGRISVVGNS